MRPVVADFISGFNSGFTITNFSPSIHHRLLHCHAHLQRREHEYYVTKSSQISVHPKGGQPYRIYSPSISRSEGQDPGSALR